MNPLTEFAHEIINGVGGLRDFERYELAVPNIDRDEATVIWTLKCLANPACELSREVLDAISERRHEVVEAQ